MTSRRQLITGLVCLIAAPAIVRATSLMPVRSFILPVHVDCLGGSTRHFETLQGAMDYVATNLNLDNAFVTISLDAGEYVGAAFPAIGVNSVLTVRGAGATIIQPPDQDCILDFRNLKSSIIEVDGIAIRALKDKP